MQRAIRNSIISALGFLVVGLGVAVVYWRYLENFAMTPGASDVRVELTIDRGTSSQKISHILEDNGLVSSATDFYLYLRFIARKAEMLRAGDYVVFGTMTPNEIIELLQKGLKKELRFSIPEGSNKDEIAEIIATSGLVPKDEMLLAMQNPALLEEFGVANTKTSRRDAKIEGGIEGYLFPDTYQFPPGTSSESILRRMNSRLQEKIDDAMKKRMEEMQWSLHDILTLASIVEKETGSPLERPQIASVFFNRLNKQMKLQTDPTVIYAIENYTGKIAKRHLSLRHSYNTYVHAGLPPGPIASPGIEAIKAVLWPAKTNYYYFVSKNDGTHVFCETYVCHQKAVKLWQIDYFKKPRATKATSSQ